MQEIELHVTRLPGADDVALPSYMSSGASGLDLTAAVTDPVTLQPHDRALIPTGIAISLPPGYEAQVRPRSGLALKHGIAMVNAPGTIDSDYRGEIKVILVNLGHEPFVIKRGMRIAQLVVSSYVKAHLKVVDTIGATVRHGGGFGHTGV